MSAREFGRGPVNELASLAKRLVPAQYAEIVKTFPDFRSELEFGPDAGGPMDLPDEEYYAKRADLALQLSAAAIQGVQEQSQKVVGFYKLILWGKTATEMASALSGGTTLVSLGVADNLAVRVCAAVTAILAIVNATAEALKKRFGADQAKKANEIQHAALVLESMRAELVLLVGHHRSVAEIVLAIENCNKYAMELNLKKQELNLV